MRMIFLNLPVKDGAIAEASTTEALLALSFQDPDGHVWEVVHMDMSQT